jgi:hypothetical protein
MTFSGKKLCRNNKIKNTEEQTKKTLGASLHGQQQKKVFLPELNEKKGGTKEKLSVTHCLGI